MVVHRVFDLIDGSSIVDNEPIEMPMVREEGGNTTTLICLQDVLLAAAAHTADIVVAPTRLRASVLPPRSVHQLMTQWPFDHGSTIARHFRPHHPYLLVVVASVLIDDHRQAIRRPVQRIDAADVFRR